MNIGMKIRRIFRLPGIRIKVEKERCIDCKLCNKSCMMGLDVHEMVQDGHVAENDCSMCGACVDICPKQAIHYGWNNN